MLDKMRSNAQSWGIKVLFGLIIIVFVFWGVGSFQSRQASIVAEVNNQPLSLQEFTSAYERTVQKLRQQNPNLSAESLQQLKVKEQVLNQLINAELLRQKAQELGIEVTLPELSQAIRSIPFFQNEQKQFDPNRYQQILRQNNLTPAQFEEDFKHNLLMEKVEKLVTLPSRVSAEEVFDAYQFALEKVQIAYLKFNWQDFLKEVKVSEEEVKKYYTDNQKEFMQPEKIKLAYLAITPQKLAPLQEVSEQEIENYYKTHKNNFFEPEKVKARHILVKLSPEASDQEKKEAEKKIADILSKLKKGEDFAKLAKKYSEGPSASRGGELGWFGKGEMIKPFEDEAFKLKKGEIGGPVQTQFGLHLIQVEDKKAAGYLSLEESKDAIKKILAQEKAYAKIQDLLDTALTRVSAGESLDKVAESIGLKVETTPLFSRQNLPEGLQGLNPKDIQALFDLPLQETTKTPLTLREGYLLAQKIEAISPAPLPFEQAQDIILSKLSLQKAREKALAKATATLKEILENKATPETTLSKPFGRQGFIPELGFSEELAKLALELKDGVWIDKPLEVGQAYVLAKPVKHILPTKEDFEKEKDKWLKIYRDFKAKEMLSAFIERLRQKAKIEIINPQYLK